MNDKIKKIMPLSGIIPALIFTTCAGISITTYSAPKYSIPTIENTTEEIETFTENNIIETETKSTESVPSVKNISETSTYKDGTYTGSAKGFGGTTTVQVVIKNGKISDIQILSHNDDSPYIDNAKSLLKTIIDAQSTNIDTVSGATYSSVGIINAVRNALSQAGGTETELETTQKSNTATQQASVSLTDIEESDSYEDGTYTGSAKGFGGTTTVQVIIKNGKISDIQILSHNDDSPYIDNAKSLLKTIINSQSTNVDTVSGATYSSAGIINAVRNALTKAGKTESLPEVTTVPQTTTTARTTKTKTTTTTTIPNKNITYTYADGVYEGTGEGYKGNVTVSVTIKNHVISSVNIVKNVDDEAYFTKASALCKTIVEKQSTDIDTVSGATFSSLGILDAVSDALSKSYQKALSEQKNIITTTTITTIATTKTTTTTTKKTDDQTENSESTTDDDSQLINSDFTGVSICYPDDSEDFEEYILSVKLHFENGILTEISEIKETGDNPDSSNEFYIQRAANGTSRIAGVITQIIESQSTENIDTVSGATCSSYAIIDAVKKAWQEN